MSAPKTDLEKNDKAHRTPLGGMALVVAFALVLLAIFAIWVSFAGNEPDGADAQIDGRTGEIEQVDTNEGAEELVPQGD